MRQDTADTVGSGLHELTRLVSTLQKKVAVLEQQQQDSTEESFSNGQHSSTDGATARPEEDRLLNTASAGTPVFAGPTSANYSLGIARMLLEQDSGERPADAEIDPELAGSVSCWEEDNDSEHEEECRQFASGTSSPVYGLQLQDALRLIEVYHECVGVLHQIVDIECLVARAKPLWHSTHDLKLDSPPDQPLEDSVVQLKMVLAIALLAEGGGSNTVAAQIHNDLQPAIANQMLAKRFNLQGQVLLLLAVSFPCPSRARNISV